MNEKTSVPEPVKRQMSEWRKGMRTPIPADYIDFHKDLAMSRLRLIEDSGYEIHNQWSASDGWMDGMRVVWVVIEDRKTGELLKIHWHDGNQEFFASTPGYLVGATPFVYIAKVGV